MLINEEGFFTPFVNEEHCIDCGICVSICSFENSEVLQDKSFDIKTYAAWSNNADVRNRCTSGGVGFEIGKSLLKQGYKALVCRYNPETHHAEHYIASNEEELLPSIGSKYIQSDAYPGLAEIKKGQKYFIVGSPCQIDSIRRWIHKRKMEEDVILLDFFCHGVPSYNLWERYLSEVNAKIGPFEDITWRSKPNGWHDSWVMEVKNRYQSFFSEGDLFYRMFLGDRCLGKACYEDCKYKYIHSAADIRIGDLWGRKYANEDLGVNGVVCLTQKGVEILQGLNGILHIEDSTLDIVTESQMKKCAHKPISHNYVMKSLKENKSLSEIDRKASRLELLEKIPRKIKYYIKRLPSKMLETIELKSRPQP